MTKRGVGSIIVLLLLSFLSAASLHAAGRSEDPVRQARRLINENRINDAILLIEQTVRDNPDRIHEAESLMRLIREIRGDYNVLFAQLIDNLINNPDNIERTLAIIAQMEKLDEFPNPRVMQQVEDARVVAQLAFDRNLVETTMAGARVDLAAARYTQAIARYQTLRTLQRDRFEQRGYGDIFLNAVEQTVGRLYRAVEQFVGQVDDFLARGVALEAALATQLPDIRAPAVEDYFVAAERLYQTRAILRTVTQDLIVQRSQVALQFPDDPLDWYLVFQEYIARGMPDFRDQEGAFGAADLAFARAMQAIERVARDRYERFLSDADRFLAQQQYQEASRTYLSAERMLAFLERNSAALAGLHEFEPTYVALGAAVTDRSLVDLRGERERLVFLARFSTTLAPMPAIPTEPAAQQTAAEAQRGNLAAVLRGIETLTEAWNAAEGVGLSREAALGPAVTGRMNQLTARLQAVRRELVEREGILVGHILALEAGAPTQDLDRIGGEVAAIAALNEGVEDRDGESDVVRIYRYPDRALSEVARLEREIAAAVEQLQATRARAAAEPPYIRAEGPVTAQTERIERYLASAQSNLTRLATDRARAQALIAQSDQFRQRGQQRINDVRAAIAALQVDAARNNWTLVRESFFEALELREDPIFRREADQIVLQLGDDLLELENIIVVRRVRELLTQADTLYNRDQYVGARDLLLEAQRAWEQTNVEANTEIDRMLRLVTAALSLEEGRELTVSDPLYPILGNYLSLAREDFERASRLHRGGQVAEGAILFDRALENLRNVRDVRPLNWDARILELRISQIRSADEFPRIFAARVEQAVARLGQASPLEVFGELEALAEINPNFPGLREQLRRLEVQLNFRAQPVEQTQVVQATQIVQRARTLASGGSRDQIVVAVSLLENAIELNPRDNDAKFLLDQLRIRLGGQATVALSSADEQQFRRAETLFSQGNVLQALAIVERLLDSATNRTYPPLVELRRRIALRLGI